MEHKKYWAIKNQLDATCYFIVLLTGSICFGHYHAHHQELATVMLITTLVVSFLVCCRLEVRCGVESRLQPGHYSSLTAPNLQPTANQERNDQCGNQHHSRELLMMGMVMPETCWAYMKFNKIKSGIYLVFYSSVITMIHDPTNIRLLYLIIQLAGICDYESSLTPSVLGNKSFTSSPI